MTVKTLRYVVVYERSPNNWGAYVPDLPGCVAVADTKEEVRDLIREGMVFHLEGMLLDNEPIPEPGRWAEELEIPHATIPKDQERSARRAG